ncbi:hypothetical protein HUN27_18770 [Agrobacterium tumefaciens]|nr:hypothetical protein [Agrobacterium tumefaciens]
MPEVLVPKSQVEGTDPVSTLVVGAGAVGLYIASCLTLAGVAVSMMSKTSFDCLCVDHGNFENKLPVVTANLRVAEYIFVCLKAHQVEAALPLIESAVTESSILVVLQNGIDHGRFLDRLVPDAQIVPCVVMFASNRSAPGCTRLVTQHPSLIIPTMPAGSAVARLFHSNHLTVQSVEVWGQLAWEKLMVNAVVGAVASFAGNTYESCLNEDLFDLCVEYGCEVATIATAEGYTMTRLDVESILRRAMISAGRHVPSIVRSREMGQATEWESRNGVIVRLAQKHGINTPLSRAFTTLLKHSERIGEPYA